MIITFISQCEHKALNRSRRVLDTFANEGLLAVKKLLRKTVQASHR